MLSVVNHESAVADGRSMLDEICREGAQAMLAAALEAEVDAYLIELVAERDENGHRLVTRNGHARERRITTVAGSVAIRAPRVEDRRVDRESGERTKFASVIVPPWCRRSPKVTEVLPLLYLHGLSTGDFVPALEGFFGASAGLSASVVTRLSATWQEEHKAFMSRTLDDRDYVYVWADGVHFNVRLEEERLCCLVIVGVRPDGRKELVAITDGYRESTDSWAALLRDLRHRGMRAPVVAVGDGALGFWGALRQVFPETKEQRCWVHKIVNVLDALPKSIQPFAKKMLGEIRDAEDKDHALLAAKAFDAEFKAKWPKAAEKIRDDVDQLFCFYDFPAEHWLHLKTSNPIESTFATVRLRTKVTKGPGSRAAGLAMAFKLIEAAEDRWRSLNGAHLIPLVRAGAKFKKGVLVESAVPEEEVAA
jgi:putative transposase